MYEAWVLPIVVGFDGSPDSVRALDWALAEAGLRGAPITLCHIWHRSHPARDAGGGDVVDAPQNAAQLVLAEGRRHAAQRAPAVHVRAELIPGRPAELLVEVARTAALLVVGARGAGGARDALLGSVSAHLARHADCPVVMVRDAMADADTRAQDRRIVVGVDASADCETAVAFAFEQAARHGVAVYAVHAFDEAAVQTVAYLPEAELLTLRQAAEDSFGTLLLAQAGKYPDLEVSFRLIQGGPVPALVEASVGADLLVLGSHDHGRFATAMRGSTIHSLLHHAACPVAVVRGDR